MEDECSDQGALVGYKDGNDRLSFICLRICGLRAILSYGLHIPTHKSRMQRFSERE